MVINQGAFPGLPGASEENAFCIRIYKYLLFGAHTRIVKGY